MTDTTQAAATETKTAPEAAVEGTGAQNNGVDLESFFKEYDEKVTPKPEPAPTPAPAANADQVILGLKAKVDAWEIERIRERDAADTNAAVKQIRGDHDVPDYVVEGWLLHAAKSDPRINSIWDNRDKDPASARKMIAGLKSKFEAEQKARKPVDKNATEDREAVTAAVRGASSNKAPEDKPPNYGKMTDAQFREELNKMGIVSPV